MVDIVLVVMVLVPMLLGILQVGLVLHVRNTLAAAAGEGARYAATVDRDPQAGAARTREQIRGALSARFARDVSATEVHLGGVPGVRVQVRAEVPPLGLWGPAVPVSVTGHATTEVAP